MSRLYSNRWIPRQWDDWRKWLQEELHLPAEAMEAPWDLEGRAEPRHLHVDAWVCSSVALISLLTRWACTLKRASQKNARHTLVSFLNAALPDRMTIPLTTEPPMDLPEDAAPMPCSPYDVQLKVLNGEVYGQDLYDMAPALQVLESRIATYSVIQRWR